MRARVLLVGCAVLAVLGCGTVSASAAPTEEAPVEAVAVAEMEMPSVAFLSSGLWTHDAAAAAAPAAETDAALLEAGHIPDDGRHGLATNGALTAHYATLRLDNTWARSHKYCASVGGALCTYAQICPRGKGHSAIGHKEIPFNRRSWAPVADKENMWVNMVPGPHGGKADRCATASDPAWGRTKKTLKSINKEWENHSKSLVACCDAGGVMKSFFRAGAKFPGSGSAEDDKAGSAADRKRRESRALDDLEKNHGADDESPMQTLINRGRISVSTSYASNHNERFLALNSAHVPGNSNAWCARTLDQNQWIEADLGRPRRILSVSTQGRGDHPQWVGKYRLQYRNKKSQSWKRVGRTSFTGNRDQNSVVKHKLRKEHITARYVRLIPESWHSHLCMRMSIGFTSKHTDGAKERAKDELDAKLDEIENNAVQNVAMPQLIARGQVKASTSYASNHNERFIALNAAHIPGNSNAWCARTLDQNQWVEVDLARSRRILGVSTQGRGDHPQWVTSYRISYRDTRQQPWKAVSRTFTANQDSNTVVRQSLRGLNIKARFVRLQPLAWHSHLCMRWDVQYTSELTDGAAEKAFDAAELKLDEVEGAAHEDVAMVKLIERGRVAVSTSYASNHNERFCALNAVVIPGNSNAWCSRALDQNQWIQADLERPRRILGVSTQGRGDAAQWVTGYRLLYRNAHGEPWKRVQRSFTGNQDSNTVVRHSLRGDYITARFIRLQPLTWHGHLSMRWDVDFTSAHTDGPAERAADARAAKMDEVESAEMQKVAMVKLLARGRVKVSSSYASNHNERFCALNAAHIPGNSNAWCAKVLDQNQWLEVDLDRPRLLLGVATQGRGDSAQWCTAYRLSYRNSEEEGWKTIGREFTGNQDSNTVVRHSLRGDEITARYVRLQPRTWQGHLSMRWDIQSTSAHTDGAAQHKADAMEQKMDQLESGTRSTVAMVQLIKRGAVSVSSSHASSHNERFCALNSPHRAGLANAWCSLALDQNQWIQADLGRPRLLLGIATQGRGDGAQWVTQYRISYKNGLEDGWTTIDRDFSANQDKQTVVRHSLRGDRITARYVRLQPLAWHSHMCLRWDVDSTSAHTDGAAEKAADAKEARLDAIDANTQSEVQMVSLLQQNRVRASTNYHPNYDYRNCALNSPQRGGFSNAWCAAVVDQNQWIEADLGSPKRILGIATQGRGDSPQWVTAYRVQYRDSHGAQWKSVQNGREFTGNQNSQTVVRHSLRNDHITARFVRLQPTAWHVHLSMRWDVDYAQD